MGIPAPVTMWEFNENIITNSSKYTIDSKGILTIRAVESSDSGLYICTANNGRQAVGSVTLNVQGKIKLMSSQMKLFWSFSHNYVSLTNFHAGIFQIYTITTPYSRHCMWSS